MNTHENRHFFLLFIIVLLCTSFWAPGCKTISSNTADQTTLEIFAAPGKLAYEDAASSDILFVAVKGGGVSGGWVEDPKGNKIPGSDLAFEPSVNRYEVILIRNEGGFEPGEYSVKYLSGGETLERKTGQLSWTIAPAFSTPPNFTFDNFTRTLTISNIVFSAGSPNLLLRFYRSETGRLVFESFPQTGATVNEHIRFTGEFRTMLIGDVFEAEQLRFRSIFMFRNRLFTGA